MDVTPELVRQVATNARLKLSDDEVKKFTLELKEILDNFAIIAQANTKDTPPSFHPIELKNIAADDEALPSIPRDDALNLTPHHTDRYFKGPKVA